MDNEWPPKEIPEPPPHLIQRALERKLVIFVGAGVSMQKGCPSWEKFADDVLEQLAQKGAITYGLKDQIKTLDPKKKLSIAQNIIKRNQNITIEYDKIILPKKENESSIYDYLKKIKCRFVTTNYDTYLHDTHPKLKTTDFEKKPAKETSIRVKECISRPEQFDDIDLSNPGPPIHLHGCLTDSDFMVVTTSDYLKHYANEKDKENKITDFLKMLFDQYTVLFVGYGLEETEILEQIFRSASAKKDEIPTRFMLVGFFSHEDQLFAHLKEYYLEDFGVHLISYDKDKNNYDQLDMVIADWANKIESPSTSAVAAFLDNVAENE